MGKRHSAKPGFFSAGVRFFFDNERRAGRCRRSAGSEGAGAGRPPSRAVTSRRAPPTLPRAAQARCPPPPPLLFPPLLSPPLPPPRGSTSGGRYHPHPGSGPRSLPVIARAGGGSVGAARRLSGPASAQRLERSGAGAGTVTRLKGAVAAVR